MLHLILNIHQHFDRNVLSCTEPRGDAIHLFPFTIKIFHSSMLMKHFPKPQVNTKSELKFPDYWEVFHKTQCVTPRGIEYVEIKI